MLNLEVGYDERIAIGQEPDAQAVIWGRPISGKKAVVGVDVVAENVALRFGGKTIALASPGNIPLAVHWGDIIGVGSADIRIRWLPRHHRGQKISFMFDAPREVRIVRLRDDHGVPIKAEPLEACPWT